VVKLTKDQWVPIWNRIKEDYPKSVWMISWAMKRELGFTVRRHIDPDKVSPFADTAVFYLDFYDEAKEIMFRLKYL